MTIAHLAVNVHYISCEIDEPEGCSTPWLLDCFLEFSVRKSTLFDNPFSDWVGLIRKWIGLVTVLYWITFFTVIVFFGIMYCAFVVRDIQIRMCLLSLLSIICDLVRIYHVIQKNLGFDLVDLAVAKFRSSIGWNHYRWLKSSPFLTLGGLHKLLNYIISSPLALYSRSSRLICFLCVI